MFFQEENTSKIIIPLIQLEGVYCSIDENGSLTPACMHFNKENSHCTINFCAQEKSFSFYTFTEPNTNLIKRKSIRKKDLDSIQTNKKICEKNFLDNYKIHKKNVQENTNKKILEKNFLDNYKIHKKNVQENNNKIIENSIFNKNISEINIITKILFNIIIFSIKILFNIYIIIKKIINYFKNKFTKKIIKNYFQNKITSKKTNSNFIKMI